MGNGKKQPGSARLVGEHYSGAKRGPKDNYVRAAQPGDRTVAGAPVSVAEYRLFTKMLESFGDSKAGGFRGWNHLSRLLWRREALLVLDVNELEALGVEVNDADLDMVRTIGRRASFALQRISELPCSTARRADSVPAAFQRFGELRSDPAGAGSVVMLDGLRGLGTLVDICKNNKLLDFAETLQRAREIVVFDAGQIEGVIQSLRSLESASASDTSRSGVARLVVIAEAVRLLETMKAGA